MALNDTISALGNAIINLIDKKTPIATANTIGMVKPDGSTINIDANGVISSNGGGGSGLEVCDIGMSLYVDETKGLRRYLNGQIVDRNTNTETFFTRLQQITTLHPSLLCTEDEWQTAKTMSAFGQVGKFVFNYSSDEIVSVRIPAIVNVQGLFDLQNLGMAVAESLPNIKGSVYFPNGIGVNPTTNSGALKYDVVGNGRALSIYLEEWYRSGNLSINASNSSSVYQDGAHVQQEAIQYPYFIQIATGSETENNIINEIELNNPYSLFECKYSDHELFNLSWLVSNGSYNGSNAVHPSAYQALLVENNAEVATGSTVTLLIGTKYTKRGLSVKLSTDSDITDYDFVVNPADETFRPPIKPRNLNNTRYLIETGEQDGISYRVYADGYCEQWGASVDASNVTFLKKFINTDWNFVGGVEHPYNNYGYDTITNKTVSGFAFIQYAAGLVQYWRVCGYLAEGEYTPLTDNILLYYYVGETIQNANLIDAGRIEEQLANKLDRSVIRTYITETYQNGTSWYRVWSDGWCEQGGQTGQLPTTSTITPIVFLKPYKDNSYSVCLQDRGTIQDQYTGGVSVYNTNFTATGFSILPYTNNSLNIYWQARGYIL